MTHISSETAFQRLQKTADLYELYFELSKFEFADKKRKNHATVFFEKRRKTIEELIRLKDKP